MTAVIPESRKRLQVIEPKVMKVVSAPVPAPRADHMLVQVKAVAINPTDWKHLEQWSTVGAGSGVDYAGVVIQAPEVQTVDTGRSWQVGDRVVGSAHGMNHSNHSDGTFAEVVGLTLGDMKVEKHRLTADQISAPVGVAMKIPDWMSFEEATTTGTGILSAGQGLFEQLPIPLDDLTAQKKSVHGKKILIWGGSTATGTVAIQLAKLAGLTVVATASPSNFDFVKSYGADILLDYHSPSIVEEIRAATDNALDLVLDTIGDHGSPETCYSAMVPHSHYVSLVFPVEPALDSNKAKELHISMVFAYLAHNVTFTKFNREYPRDPRRYAFACQLFAIAEQLVEQKRLVPHPGQLRAGGLDGLVDGMEMLKRGEVRAAKLVYTIA